MSEPRSGSEVGRGVFIYLLGSMIAMGLLLPVLVSVFKSFPWALVAVAIISLLPPASIGGIFVGAAVLQGAQDFGRWLYESDSLTQHERRVLAFHGLVTAGGVVLYGSFIARFVWAVAN